MGKKQQRAVAAAHPVTPKGGLEKKKTKKKMKTGTAALKKGAAAPSTTSLPTRVAPPPPVYRLKDAPAAAAADSDESDADAPAAPYLTPSSPEYAPCLAHSYVGFHVDQPKIMDASFHDKVTGALNALVTAGYFHYDVLAAGKSVTPTFVQRTLLGARGMTYHYQKLRIFAHPWVGLALFTTLLCASKTHPADDA
jgi:hypothetical protein